MLQLGRKPRIHNPSVPHMSALMGGMQLPYPPIAIDYARDMPSDFGMMLNDRLGDCTCAAYYHARQIWSFNAGQNEITDCDADVLSLYENACGYNPQNPDTDQGGVEQDVLTYLLNTGAPECDPITAFVEIDPRNLDDMRRAVADCGVAYIGISCPESVVSSGEPAAVWDVVPGSAIAGGHAIVLCGYDLDGFHLISWGRKYKASNEFLAAYCDEAYAIADPKWIAATGKTPLGMSIHDLEIQMHGLKNNG